MPLSWLIGWLIDMFSVSFTGNWIAVEMIWDDKPNVVLIICDGRLSILPNILKRKKIMTSTGGGGESSDSAFIQTYLYKCHKVNVKEVTLCIRDIL